MPPPTQSLEHLGAGRNQDIDFEVIEAGGEESEAAQITAAPSLSTDLSDIFGTTSRSPVITEGSIPPGATTTHTRESTGGDYIRYASRSSADYTTPPHALNATKHAKLVLSHRKDVNLNQRAVMSNIVKSSIPTSQ